MSTHIVPTPKPEFKTRLEINLLDAFINGRLLAATSREEAARWVAIQQQTKRRLDRLPDDVIPGTALGILYDLRSAER